jgi:peptidoglycan/LPS O-acetylase OafA/YrhL
MTGAEAEPVNDAGTADVVPDSASATFWDRYFAAKTVEEPTTQCKSKLPYIPALDGIRAIAVIAVLLYHANISWFQGGFLGVEVFFVLSGYLITSLLLAERRQSGRVDLKNFWLRRARRLLPALFLLLVVTLAYAVIMLPQQVTQLRADATAAVFYVMNWWLIFDHKPYFEAMGRESLLKHLWSLAVEEQFYLIWPPLFVLAYARLRERRLLLLVLAGASVSTLLMAALFRSGADTSLIYYGTDTRAAELLIGAALAFVWKPSEPRIVAGRLGPRIESWFKVPRNATIVLESVGIASLAGVMIAFHSFGEFSSSLYRGGFLLVALITAALIAVVVHPRSRFVSRWLGCAPLRWIGLRSYGIYLWHWPVYMVTRPGLDVPLHGVSLLVLRVSITLIMVEISYRLVETPFRSGQVGRIWRSLRHEREQQPRAVQVGWLGVTGAVAMSTLALGIVVAEAKPADPPPYLSVQEVHIEASPSPVVTLPSTPTVQEVTPTATAESSSPTPTPDPMPIVSLSPPSDELPATVAPTPAEPTSTPSPTPTPLPTTPVPTPTPGASYASSPAVTAIGDSVMLGASDELVAAIPNLDLDAKVGLQVSEAIQILQARLYAGRLHDVIVLDIGNNGPMSSEEFDQIMQVLGSERRVIFLNLRVPRSWEGPNNAVLESGVSRYPNAQLLDWHGATANHPELFWDDGLHLRPVGANYYSMLVANMIASGN